MPDILQLNGVLRFALDKLARDDAIYSAVGTKKLFIELIGLSQPHDKGNELLIHSLRLRTRY